MIDALNLKILYKSFFDRSVYVESMLKRKGIFFLYIAMLTFIFACPLLMNLSSKYSSFFKEELLPACRQIPAIEIAGGKLTYEGPETLAIKMKNEGRDLAVFHSGDSIKDIDQVNAYVLVLSDKIITHTPSGKRIVDIKGSGKEFSISAGFFDMWVRVISIALLIILIPVMILGIFIRRIVHIAVFALIAFIVFRIKKTADIKFAQCWRLSVVAVTPVVLVLAFFNFMYSPGAMGTFLNIVMTGSYLYFGIDSFFRKQKESENNALAQDNINSDTKEVKNDN